MKESFIKIPINLITKDIPKPALLLLGLLISNSKQKGYAYGSNKYYSEMLNVSIRSITSYLEYLSLQYYHHSFLNIFTNPYIIVFSLYSKI